MGKKFFQLLAAVLLGYTGLSICSIEVNAGKLPEVFFNDAECDAICDATLTFEQSEEIKSRLSNLCFELYKVRPGSGIVANSFEAIYDKLKKDTSNGPLTSLCPQFCRRLPVLNCSKQEFMNE